MNWLANIIMKRRSRQLFERISAFLPRRGQIADIGSGVGHNAQQIRARTELAVQEFDVVDLHWVGPGPTLISNGQIPAADNSMDASLLLYVLQYPASIDALLNETRRVTTGTTIVIQSTYSGRWGRLILAIREFIWGRLAFRIATWARLVPKCDCPLDSPRYYTRHELTDTFQRCGFVIRQREQSHWPGLNVSRDLFVLETSEK